MIRRRSNPFNQFKRNEKTSKFFIKDSQKKAKKRTYNLEENRLLAPSLQSEHHDLDMFESYGSDGFKSDGNNSFESYGSELKKVDEAWKGIQLMHLKNALSDVCDLNVKDTFDVYRNELLFEPHISGKYSTQNTTKLKVLCDINDLDLDTVLKSAANNEFMKDLLGELHFLATKNNVPCANKVIEILKEEHKVFSCSKGRILKRNFPRLQTVILLNVIEKIYSPVKYLHPIVTPAMIFMADILCSKFCYTFSNILTRLLITDIVLNCISMSKSFIPEALQFLKTVLQLALPRKNESKKCFDLVIKEKIASESIPTLQLHPPTETSTLESKKISVIFTIVSQVFRFATLYTDYPLFKIIFEPFLAILPKLPVHFYPAEAEAIIKRLVEFLDQPNPPPLSHLSFPAVKPKPLQMFEPDFECRYEPLIAEYKPKSKTQQKRVKNLTKKIKKEEKGWLRDIRKSAKTDAAVKLKQKQEMDMERRLKTKKILSELAVQEGVFKKLGKKH